MYLQRPPQTSDRATMLDQAREEDGYVMNLLHVWAWRPGVHEAFLRARQLLREQTRLSAREIALLNSATAAARGNSYCAIAWGTKFAQLADDEAAACILSGGTPPELSLREQRLLQWARVVVSNPNATTDADVSALRDAGLNDEDILDATLFVAFRLAFTTVNDALGALPDRQLADEAPDRVLKTVHYGRPVDASETVT